MTHLFLLLLLLSGAAGGAAGPDRVKCRTTKGDFTIEMTPERGPLGAQRFMELVNDGFFTDIPLFRVVPGFLVQYGIPGRIEEKEKWSKWTSKSIADDPHPEGGKSKFSRGDMSFAGAGPNSRTTQVFVAYRDGSGLGGALHETPFGKVVEGMEVVDSFYSYGDTAPFASKGPDQGKMWAHGNSYLKENFPKMDYVVQCMVLQPEAAATPTPVASNAAVHGAEHTSVMMTGDKTLFFGFLAAFLLVAVWLRRLKAAKSHGATE